VARQDAEFTDFAGGDYLVYPLVDDEIRGCDHL
jgi:hypothetical protein